MPYRFVNQQDVLQVGGLLKQQGVPLEKWGDTIPKMLGALEETRFQKQPPIYKNIYTAATKADPFTRAMMGTFTSLIGKTSGALLESAGRKGQGFFSNLNLVHQAVNDALVSGEAEPETWGGRLLQDTLPSLAPDLPLFALGGRAGVHPSIMLGTYSAARQGLDITAGKQEKFNLKTLAKAMVLGGVLKYMPVPEGLQGVGGGAALRVGKRLVGLGVKALPASFVSPAVELLDPTTNEKWKLEDFAHTWALFATLDAWGLIKAGQFGALETQLKSQGLRPKQAKLLSNLAAQDPRASIHKMFSVLMKNKVGIKNAANAWKVWQARAGARPAEPPMKTAAMEREALALRPELPLREQLVSALETRAMQRGVTPHRAKWYTKAAAVIRTYEGDLAGLDNEGVRNLLGVKGKKSKAVDTVVKEIKKIEKSEKLPVPLPPPGQEFAEPTVARYVTPQDRYIYTLGLQDILMPAVEAKTNMLLERQRVFNWMDGLEQTYLTKAGATKGEKLTARLKNIPTKAHVQLWGWLNTPKMKLKDIPLDHRDTYKSLRKLTDEMIERANVVREHVGLEPIRYLDGYVRYIHDLATNKDIRERHPFPPDIEHWLKLVHPTHVFNPTALKRMGKTEGLLKDPFKALKAMTSSDLKQIYLEQPNLMFKEQLETLTKRGELPAPTRAWAESYMNVVVKGYPSEVDKMADRSLEALKIPQLMTLILKPFNRVWGPASARNISNGLGRIIHDAVIWGRVKLVIRNHTQKLLSLGLYDSKAFLNAMRPASPELLKMVKDSRFFQISKSSFMEALPQGALGKLEKIGFIPYGRSHMSNVLFTMKTAYHAGTELVNNPKYADLGWTKEDVMKEMEFGASTAQYWYNSMGSPELYRHKSIAAFFKLQTWFMNYGWKYWREMLHRFFQGETGWGKPIPTKWRVGALRHIISSLIFVEGLKRAFGLDYRRIALLGVLPTYLSPMGQVTVGLGKLLVSESDWEKKEALRMLQNSWKAFLPTSGAWQDVAKVWSGDEPIKSLFFHTVRE